MKTLALLLTLAFAILSRAQTSAFEVASIKLNLTDSHTSSAGTDPGGKFNATNLSLKDLIAYAYGVRDSQITGVPRELEIPKYDIVARADTQKEMSRGEVAPCVRAMLADRFRLKIHRETKEGSVYALVLAKSGPKLTAHTGTSGVTGIGGSSGSGKASIEGSKASMAGLADHLAGKAGRPVIDKTGLTGEYDFRLEWASEQAPDSTLPSLFTAIQEQLGLRLESTRGPIEMIVVEGATNPSEN
jgi:uncharacterized protein (TIGR03435 family)